MNDIVTINLTTTTKLLLSYKINIFISLSIYISVYAAARQITIIIYIPINVVPDYVSRGVTLYLLPSFIYSVLNRWNNQFIKAFLYIVRQNVMKKQFHSFTPPASNASVKMVTSHKKIF